MKVSIVTISYNQAGFLERAIKSVLEQDYGNIEYIIVDPGSTDGSREIIERYRDKIAKVIFEPDKGPADGLNKGFAHATGDIFGYINSDDAYLPSAVREAVQVFQKDSSLDVVYGWGYIIDQHNKIIKRFRSTPFTLWRFAYGGAWIMQQSTFFKKQAFFDVNGFNIENRTCWDGEMLADFGLSGKRFKLIRRYWSVFTIHNSSISGSRRLEKQYLCDSCRIFKKIIGREPKPFDVILRMIVRLEKWLLMLFIFKREKTNKKNQLFVQYGCHHCAPKTWRNFDASPTLRFERFPILGRLYTKNPTRFPKNVEYGDIVKGLPLSSNSCNGIYASHILEHLALEDFRVALKNTYQLLRPGGIFRLVVPDLEILAKNYVESDLPDAAEKFMQATSLGIVRRSRSLLEFLKLWLGNSSHLWMWDYKSLEHELRNVGFKDIRRAFYGDCEYPEFMEVENPERFKDAVCVECRK